jgi:hypothetical protein
LMMPRLLDWLITVPLAEFAIVPLPAIYCPPEGSVEPANACVVESAIAEVLASKEDSIAARNARSACGRRPPLNIDVTIAPPGP